MQWFHSPPPPPPSSLNPSRPPRDPRPTDPTFYSLTSDLIEPSTLPLTPDPRLFPLVSLFFQTLRRPPPCANEPRFSSRNPSEEGRPDGQATDQPTNRPTGRKFIFSKFYHAGGTTNPAFVRTLNPSVLTRRASSRMFDPPLFPARPPKTSAAPALLPLVHSWLTAVNKWLPYYV